MKLRCTRPYYSTESARMTAVDVIGWLAAVFTLLTFSMRKMIGLRCIAIASNILFIVFGILASIMPVFVLHLFLLPCNLIRLYQIWAARAQQNKVHGGPAQDGASLDVQDREWDHSRNRPQGHSVIFTGSPRLGEVRVIASPNVAR